MGAKERIEEMKKATLVVSVALNVILVVLIAGSIRYSRRTAFQTIADATTAEVRLQEHILKELDSNDSKRIEVVKDIMRRNIENGKKVAGTWSAAARW